MYFVACQIKACITYRVSRIRFRTRRGCRTRKNLTCNGHRNPSSRHHSTPAPSPQNTMLTCILMNSPQQQNEIPKPSSSLISPSSTLLPQSRPLPFLTQSPQYSNPLSPPRPVPPSNPNAPGHTSPSYRHPSTAGPAPCGYTPRHKT